MIPENNKIDDINTRLENLISKSKNADKYELLRNGLNLVKGGAIGFAVPITVLAVGTALALPFVSDLQQIRLSNVLGPELMDSFTAIATMAVAHYSSKQVNKHVEKESKEIEDEYSSMKEDTFNMRNEGDYKNQNMVEHLKAKLHDADILSPVEKREKTFDDLIERKKRRSNLKFT
jgi:hypothetical protein